MYKFIKKVRAKLRDKKPAWVKLIWWKFKVCNLPGQGASYITCTGKIDGIGAQAQAVLSTILFAREFGLVYAHTPFKEIAHNTDKQDAARKWESFLGLGQGEVGIETLRLEQLNVVRVDSPRKIRNRKNTLYIIRHCHEFADEVPNCYLKLKKRILQKYKSVQRNSFQLHQQAGRINIALHIRRGDVSAASADRFTDNRYYYKILTDLLSVLDALQLSSSIHLYSQGTVEDFSEFEEFHLSYHLDECPFETLHNLIEADVLVMSKSSFSYSAALLSNSVKLYQPFWHKPLRNWIVADRRSDAQTSFDKSQFRKRLVQYQRSNTK